MGAPRQAAPETKSLMCVVMASDSPSLLASAQPQPYLRHCSEQTHEGPQHWNWIRSNDSRAMRSKNVPDVLTLARIPRVEGREQKELDVDLRERRQR
jgi:hypothetical protein